MYEIKLRTKISAITVTANGQLLHEEDIRPAEGVAADAQDSFRSITNFCHKL